MELSENKDKIIEEINKYKLKIENISLEIKKSSDFEQKVKLYQEIFSIDNTQEKYVLEYLLYLKEMNIQYKGQTNFLKELERLQICISDSNYNKFFKEYPRKNARNKILNFINLIKDSPLKNNEQKSKLIDEINFLIFEVDNLKMNNKKKITWENEELFLYSLYEFLILNVSQVIIYYIKKNINSKIFQDEEYNEINNKLKNEKNEIEIQKLNMRKNTILLLHSKFFEYIDYMKKFLVYVEKYFRERFGNLELDKYDDKLLFEDYIHFLATYNFKESSFNSFWKEVFVSLNLEEKKNILGVNFEIKFDLIENGQKLKISDDYNNFIIIEVDKYNLINLIYDFKYERNVNNIKWKLSQYMKPNYYKENLFVCKTREHWKKLLISIFQSKAFKQVRNSLFTASQVDFFLIDDIISNIIDNIKFFIYNTSFLDNTNIKRNTIYEYGNINLNIENESIALLIFYGFHIIINLNEIGGYLNAKYQYYISLDENFLSPEIEDYLKPFYIKSNSDRKSKIGEKIEIGLFGEVKQTLTIKEALFILNKDNYSSNSDEFKKKFLDCNNKNLDELLNESLKELLTNLGIDSTQLSEDVKEIYSYALKRKSDEVNAYYENKTRHPINFYYDGQNLINEYIKNYCFNIDSKNEK